MSVVLAKKHESLATTIKIMDSLREMFGQPSWSLKHEAIKYIYTKQMKEGTSVREHVLDMMMHFNIAEVNGGPINEANQNLTMGKGKEVVANVRSSFKTRIRPSLMKKKRKGKTPKNSKGKKVAKDQHVLGAPPGHRRPDFRSYGSACCTCSGTCQRLGTIYRTLMGSEGKGRGKLASDREGSVTCHMGTQFCFRVYNSVF
ncbi:gag/pol protein [Cucumis melo var. makuwa]|uniref:Gag/pol protein n=1 Tax=Cucumis melo var. makuwa TaxID=1194695 RepID=A0A5D3B9S5_CUCMM|nr:gag/pol protein [Cucumis melo var. makuwa]